MRPSSAKSRLIAEPALRITQGSLGRPAGCAPNLAQSRRRAFTLIELLLAVAVFAIALLAIHGVFYSAIKLRDKTAGALDAAVPLQHAVAIIKRDLANIVPPGGVLSGQLQTSGITTGTGARSSNWGLATVSGRQVGAAFYTATGILTEAVPWPDIERVAYYLVEPTNNAPGKDLVRVVWRNPLPVLTDEPEAQWLMGGVQDMTFSFFDGFEGTDAWDSTAQQPALPLAIRVELELAPGISSSMNDARPNRIEFVVPVMVQARTDQTVAALGAMP
ncbi:MAG: prepilin-type N-terminal cleavage/methylation domain-containing protein [Verrucomicrobiae bacterium]|nr:prepilin-type N-terminal cleavage/methylation domain-containing protein [Verrucomicrobiae bacterium]